MGVLAVEAFKGGGIDPSLRLLTADPLGYLEDAALFESVARSQGATMAEWQAALDQLRADEATVAARLSEIESLEQTLAARKADIERQLADAEAVLAEAQRIEAERQAAVVAASRDRSGSGDAEVAGVATGAAPVSGGSPVGTSCADIAIQAPSARAAAAIDFACSQIGKPYQWGASGPSSYDCSGLTSAAYAAAGVSLPRSSRQQYASGVKVARSDIQPGDLVYFYSPISHVGIYVGNGSVIDAPRTGKPVAIRSMEYMPYAGATRP
jgi:cell wall-associated NlpC family hydrolase